MVAAWFLPSQATRRADALLDLRGEVVWVAPHCFAYEAPNLLLRAERSGRLLDVSPQEVLDVLRDSLRVQVQPPPPPAAISHGLELARRLRLSLFDAFFLMLAQDGASILASRDRPLLAAAATIGVTTYDAGENA